MGIKQANFWNYSFMHMLIYYHEIVTMITLLLSCSRFYGVNKLENQVLLVIIQQHQVVVVLIEEY